MAVSLSVTETGKYILNGLEVDLDAVLTALCGINIDGNAPATVAVIEDTIPLTTIIEVAEDLVTPPPVLAPVGTTFNENTIARINILNYESSTNYVVASDVGDVIVRPGQNYITLTTFDTLSDTVGTISITGTRPGYNTSEVVTVPVTIIDNRSFVDELIYNNDFQLNAAASSGITF